MLGRFEASCNLSKFHFASEAVRLFSFARPASLLCQFSNCIGQYVLRIGSVHTSCIRTCVCVDNLLPPPRARWPLYLLYRHARARACAKWQQHEHKAWPAAEKTAGVKHTSCRSDSSITRSLILSAGTFLHLVSVQSLVVHARRPRVVYTLEACKTAEIRS